MGVQIRIRHLPGVGIQLDIGAESSVFAFVPVDQSAVRASDACEPADAVSFLDDGYTVTSQGGNPGGLQAGGPGTHDDHIASVCRRYVPVGVFRLPSARRFGNTGHDRIAGVANLASLVASGAGANQLAFVAGEFGH